MQIADSTGEFGSLMGKVQGIVWDLTHAEATVECIWDPTLHLGSLGKGKSGNPGITACSACPPVHVCECAHSCHYSA